MRFLSNTSLWVFRLSLDRGAIAPTIAISIEQSAAVANYFTTVGYLVGIITVLSVSILPRGKFIQTILLNILFACSGAAVGCLILWSSLQARLQTQSRPLNPASGLPPYNSSQSAVSAVWLFVMIWFVNTLRAKQPTLNVPVIVFSIFTNISATYSPIMTSNAAFEAIILRILTAFLTAFALATGCSLLILPTPSRKVTFGQMKGLIMLLRGAVKQEKLYMQSLEREDMFATPQDVSSAMDNTKNHSKKSAPAEPVTCAEAKALKGTISGIRQLAGKLQADLPFAKRDFSWGKLDAADLKSIFLKLRACLIPIIGMSTIIDVFQRVAERHSWAVDAETPAELLAQKTEEKRIWNEVMRQLHEPFKLLSDMIDQGLEHVGLCLELLPRPKSKKQGSQKQPNGAPDIEAQGDLVKPGDPEFAKVLEEKVNIIKVSVLSAQSGPMIEKLSSTRSPMSIRSSIRRATLLTALL